MAKKLIFKTVEAYAKKRNLSIAELEKRAGLSPGAIYKWKEVEPKIGGVMNVAKELGVTVNTLLKDT